MSWGPFFSWSCSSFPQAVSEEGGGGGGVGCEKKNSTFHCLLSFSIESTAAVVSVKQQQRHKAKVAPAFLRAPLFFVCQPPKNKMGDNSYQLLIPISSCNTCDVW